MKQVFSVRSTRNRRTRSAFTLVELLVVIAIIGALVGILLPSINSARKNALNVKCMNNLRQVALALINYSAGYHGVFPPYVTDGGTGLTMAWYDADRIGQYISGKPTNPALDGFSPITAPVMVCPQDDHSLRSYAMNVWACSAVDSSFIPTPPPGMPAIGQLWRGSGHPMSNEVILVTERWSTTAVTGSTNYVAPAIIGKLGNKPGLRFGVGAGVAVPTNTHWKSNPTSELPYLWHRGTGDGGAKTQSYGRVNIAFCDGHVTNYRVEDLASRVTTLSTLVALWSPLDEIQNGP